MLLKIMQKKKEAHSTFYVLQKFNNSNYFLLMRIEIGFMWKLKPAWAVPHTTTTGLVYKVRGYFRQLLASF